MSNPENSLVTIYMVRYSENLVFYWTVGQMSRRMPVIKYGDIFVPVKEHHTLIILAAKIVEIAELRMDGKYVDPNEYRQSIFQGMLFGNESSWPTGLDWPEVIFSNPKDGFIPADFKHYRDRTKAELVRLLSQH